MDNGRKNAPSRHWLHDLHVIEVIAALVAIVIVLHQFLVA
jgi:hypothetical protein